MQLRNEQSLAFRCVTPEQAHREIVDDPQIAADFRTLMAFPCKAVASARLHKADCEVDDIARKLILLPSNYEGRDRPGAANTFTATSVANHLERISEASTERSQPARVAVPMHECALSSKFFNGTFSSPFAN